jgi:hypothetical protein
MTVSISGTGGITFDDSSVQNTAATGFGFKNRIINGAMVIDQRNAGAAISSGYVVDRFNSANSTDGVYTIQQVSDAPAGFNYSAKLTVTTADASLAAGQFSSFFQVIEGYNLADLSWGTANAQTVTLSFWVKSNLTGAFGGSLRGASSTRSFPFTYTISVANTWEQKSVTIVGCPDGTWGIINDVGVQVFLSIGTGSTLSGTAGAWASASYRSATGATNVLATIGNTIQWTGVQLEKGSTATSFDYRPYGTEEALCQRYYTKFTALTAGDKMLAVGYQTSTTGSAFAMQYPVAMRSEPTCSILSLASTDSVNYDADLTLTSISSGYNSGQIRVSHSAVGAQFRPCSIYKKTSTAGYIDLTAEL